MATFNVEVLGLDSVKKLFSDIENDLSAAQLRGVLDDAGRIIISEAKAETPYTGIIAQMFKKDLGVYRDRRTAAKHAEYILVGERFKPYTIHGREQKVAVIAQHMTQGFSQTDRKGRGKVKFQTLNPVLDAYRNTKQEQNTGINNGVIKRINKIKAQNASVVQ